MNGNKSITRRDEDFAKWYTDVVMAAKLARYSNVKGCILYEPNGTAIWEKIQQVLDKKFKETGHKNVQMPMLIPESLLRKEGDLVKGFAPEVAWVTEGGDKKLDERLCIRPTSETLFSDYYHEVVKSYKDLPLKYNQWCNVMRWEKEARPFLRGREFFWQEGHTVHATKEEAEAETKGMLDVYKEFFEDYLAIPVLTGRKTEKEKFAGAEYTLTVEALMYNGVSLQSGTTHYFGQKFSKAYDIRFVNSNNEFEYAYQTSWGVSNRMIGAIIMVHGDDNGLILPPRIAPIQVAIIKATTDNETDALARKIQKELDNNDISSYIDDSDKSFGFKMAEAEVNGIPVRIELGKRDIDNGVITISRRDTLEKNTIGINDNVVDYVFRLMDSIQANLYDRALKRRDSMTYHVNTLDEIKKIMDTQPGFIYSPWCGSTECELKMKEIKGLKSRCIVEDNEDGVCPVCGKKSKHTVVWGIQY
jgi:prolyl-tRNA synthetase